MFLKIVEVKVCYYYSISRICWHS